MPLPLQDLAQPRPALLQDRCSFFSSVVCRCWGSIPLVECPAHCVWPLIPLPLLLKCTIFHSLAYNFYFFFGLLRLTFENIPDSPRHLINTQSLPGMFMVLYGEMDNYEIFSSDDDVQHVGDILIESQGWQLLIYDLLAQNMSFFSCCSAIMEVGLTNISPLPTSKTWSIVIREGAGGTLGAKGSLFHVLVCLACWVPAGCSFSSIWLLSREVVPDPSLWSWRGPTHPAASPGPPLMASEWGATSKAQTHEPPLPPLSW